MGGMHFHDDLLMHPLHQPKTNDFGRKISLHFGVHPPPTSLNLTISAFGEDLFFFFFGRPPEFGRKKRSNFLFPTKIQSPFQ